MNKLHHSVYRKAHRSFRISAPLHRNSYTVYFGMGAPFDRNLQRMGDNMAMDMDSGELHMVSSWDDDDE